MLTEKQIAAIHEADLGRYDCLASDFIDISNAVGGGVIATGMACYRYGFIKGRRAERAAAKKMACRETENRAPGYENLLALIEKNMNNKRFVQNMTALALGFTGDKILDKAVEA